MPRKNLTEGGDNVQGCVNPKVRGGFAFKGDARNWIPLKIRSILCGMSEEF